MATAAQRTASAATRFPCCTRRAAPSLSCSRSAERSVISAVAGTSSCGLISFSVRRGSIRRMDYPVRVRPRLRPFPASRAPGRALAEARGDPQCRGLVDLGLEAQHDAALLPDERVAREPQRVGVELPAAARVEDLVRRALEPGTRTPIHRHD